MHDDDTYNLHFDSFSEAKNWAIKNIGSVLSRSGETNGFIVKHTYS